MFLKKEKLILEALILIAILIYSYFINWHSGNIGIIPIDSFGFLDTGYRSGIGRWFHKRFYKKQEF